MAQKPFGGNHTLTKLEIIEEYLRTYRQAFKNLDFETIYIDAFAGTGEIPTRKFDGEGFLEFDDEAEEVVKGSAVRAVDLESPFHKYIFIEEKHGNISSLEESLKGHSNFERCSFRQEDANDELLKICRDTNWKKVRAVVFLDPFGNQVAWDTIAVLAATKAVDLWYLFPSGVGVFRQISRKGAVHDTHTASIDRMLGTPDWRQAFVTEKISSDLFGEHRQAHKTVTPESATEFMIERMRGVFEGVVLDETIPLGRVEHGYPSFNLIFASANPSEKAKTLASRIAKAVIRTKGSNGWLK